MGWLADLIHSVVIEFKRIVPIPPFRTLRITHVNRGLSCWWHVARQQDGSDLMQVVGDFLVTNLTGQTVTLAHALINRKKRIKGMVLVGGLSGREATTFLLPNQSEECRIQFYISPPLKDTKDTYVDDIAIVDSFGNRHWFKRCQFEYL